MSPTGDVEQRSDGSFSGESSNILPPVAPAKSIFNNELRGRSGAAAEFSSQPEPPQPRRTSPTVTTGPLSPATAQGTFSTTAPRHLPQNPSQQLNPNQILRNTPLGPAGQQRFRSDVNEQPTSSSPAFQRNTLPPIDNRSDIQRQPTQSIPAASPVANPTPRKQSVLAPISSTISDDSSVAAVGFNAPVAKTSNGRTAVRDLLSTYDVSSSTNPLPGVPVSLKELIQTTPIQYRHAMVQQYWETFFDWATLTNRMEYSQWLKQLPNARVQAEQTLMQTAKSMAANDVVAAEIQLAKSQSKLRQLSKANTQDLLPLPMNQPLVTKYKTHYEWYQGRNLLPEKLLGINEMLPRTYQLIDQRATTAKQAQNVRDQFKNSFAGGQSGAAELLESGRTWQTAVQSFVSTVVNYNQAISDYALTITSPQKPVDQIVSMLVAKPKSVNEAAARNTVIRQNSQPFGQGQQSSQARTARLEQPAASNQRNPNARFGAGNQPTTGNFNGAGGNNSFGATGRTASNPTPAAGNSQFNNQRFSGAAANNRPGFARDIGGNGSGQPSAAAKQPASSGGLSGQPPIRQPARQAPLGNNSGQFSPPPSGASSSAGAADGGSNAGRFRPPSRNNNSFNANGGGNFGG